MRQKTIAQSGRSMVEMLGVLAIMGVITVAAVAMISTAMRNQKRNATSDEATQIAIGVRMLLGEYNDFSGINPRTIFGALGVSDRNPYGGKYLLAPDTDPHNFVLTIDGLNKSDCQFFATRAWTESVGYRASDGRNGGAVAVPADCSGSDGTNIVKITYGE
jgi:type II secretory pathway pseudopilin PulG